MTVNPLKPDFTDQCPPRIFGGHLVDVPKPHIYYFSGNPRKRRVEVKVIKYFGCGVHYWASVKGEGNYVWDITLDGADEPGGYWRRCWDDPECNGRIFEDKFNTVEAAEQFVRDIVREHFPPSIYEYRDFWFSRPIFTWHYGEGD